MTGPICKSSVLSSGEAFGGVSKGVFYVLAWCFSSARLFGFFSVRGSSVPRPFPHRDCKAIECCDRPRAQKRVLTFVICMHPTR